MKPTPASGPKCECNWLAKIWNAIHGKQNKLTPGAGITIDEHDVISSTAASPEWGSITGDLDDQTDLKYALDSKANTYDTYTKDETDVLLGYKADVSSVEAIEDELGSVGQAGTIRNDIALVNDRVDSVEDEIGPETTAGTLRYKIKENANDIVSIENEIDIIDGIIAAHSTAINGKADKTYVDAHINDTNNPHSVTKSQIGLSNVDNTSDLSKPISTATQAALNNKADKKNIPTLTMTFDDNQHVTGAWVPKQLTWHYTRDHNYADAFSYTNNAITVKSDGVYLVTCNIGMSNCGANKEMAMQVMCNNIGEAISERLDGVAYDQSRSGSIVQWMPANAQVKVFIAGSSTDPFIQYGVVNKFTITRLGD